MSEQSSSVVWLRKQRLLWLVRDSGGTTGHRTLHARTTDGAYIIEPHFGSKKPRGRPWPFEGYEVRWVSFVKLNNEYPGDCDDPEYVVDESDIREIKSGVQSESEAKAIAQADADQVER